MSELLAFYTVLPVFTGVGTRTAELYGIGVCTIQIDNHGVVVVRGKHVCVCIAYVCLSVQRVRPDGQRFPVEN